MAFRYHSHILVHQLLQALRLQLGNLHVSQLHSDAPEPSTCRSYHTARSARSGTSGRSERSKQSLKKDSISWHSMVHDAYVMWQRKKDRDRFILLYRKSPKNVWWSAYHRKWVDYDRLSCRQSTQFDKLSSNCCAYFSFCFELSLSASCSGFALVSHLLWRRKGKNENPKEAMTAWTTLVRKLKRTKSKDLGSQSFGLNIFKWI